MIRGRDKNAIEETAKKEVCVQGDDGRGKKESNKAEHTEEMEAEGKTRDQIGWRKRRKMAGGEVLLPACSAESSQQVGARASPWPPSDWRLCSFCCGMLSTYFTGATSLQILYADYC